MIVAAGAVKDFTNCFDAATGGSIDPRLSEDLIRQVRSTIGKKVLRTEKRQALVVSSLIILKGALLEHSNQIRGAWTIDDWAEVLWTLFESSIARTQTGSSVESVLSSDGLWHAAVSTALGEVRDCGGYSWGSQ